ncbi:MAG TPA: DNA-formamidopyrimidine glycosylase family protein [Spirochaetales bacterium]|nr:DNA-formamidopyrimidine glycosylase family protein [Spirochaetales bacterium]
MPELPDLVHIVRALGPALLGRRVEAVRVKNPLVLRVLLPGDFGALLEGRRFEELERHGPFLRFGLGAAGLPAGAGAAGEGARIDVVAHLMLAGRLRLAPRGEKPLAYTAFALDLDSGETLSYGDEKSMGKIYLCARGCFEAIPGYLSQGVDVTGPGFTYEAFSALIAKKRCQARVFVMDQSSLSAIGNAYADEILFEAGIHPKAPCSSLPEERRRALYEAVKSVLAWGTEEVEKAGRPLEDKVRGHLRVRNRAGEACPRCGATIRKAGVLGFDAFFCPICQPDKAGRGLDWSRLEGPR